jgi:hypothetical protein
VLLREVNARKGGNAERFIASVARTAFIELYMLKEEGQGDEGNFISRGKLETEGIQRIRLSRTSQVGPSG